MKKYVKAKVVAKNSPQGSYAAGCAAVRAGDPTKCKNCEWTK